MAGELTGFFCPKLVIVVSRPTARAGGSVVLTAEDLDLRRGTEDVRSAGRQLRGRLMKHRGAYVRLGSLVAGRLDGNCRPAVSCALRRLIEGLRIQILHRSIRDL